jgi:hypothetical protein
MTAPTDQFVDIAKRSQEAVSTAVRSWADTVQSFAGNLNAGQGQLPNPQNVVDTYFDFAEKVLANQRQLTTQFVSASVKAGETVQEQVSKVTEQVTAHTVNGADTAAQKATEATTEATARTARAARNVAKG